MSDLPREWVTATLEEIADINPRHPSGLDPSLPVTFVAMAALSETSPGFKSSEVRPLGKVRNGYTHFAEGDVLFAKITPCMENGKAAVATGLKNGLGCGTTELHVLRPLGDIPRGSSCTTSSLRNRFAKKPPAISPALPVNFAYRYPLCAKQ